MDDKRFTELMGFLGTFLSRGTYALETIAGAQTAMAKIEIERYDDWRTSPAHHLPIALCPAQCQEPCCRREEDQP